MSLFSNIAALLSKLPSREQAQPQFNFAAPQLNPNAMSIFDLIRPPQQAQFNVTAAQGTKPKNFRPGSVTMSGIPAAAVFSMPGANPLPQQVFSVTPASGTKPKNYTPTKVTMNAPTIAGPQAMQQMLAMMGGLPNPFGTNGQG